MRLISVVSAIIVSLFFALPSVAEDVTGVWVMSMESPRGEMTREVEFIQEGEKLTVIMQDRRGGAVTYEGTVVGNAIEWSGVRETPRGDMKVSYQGTIDGDTMAGTSQFGDQFTSEWTAKRKE